MKKIYQIKNSNYETKKVVADNMFEALQKYEQHLTHTISIDFPIPIDTITDCVCLGDYEEEDLIK